MDHSHRTLAIHLRIQANTNIEVFITNISDLLVNIVLEHEHVGYRFSVSIKMVHNESDNEVNCYMLHGGAIFYLTRPFQT